MRVITIKLTEEDEKNICKLISFKNEARREILGPDYPVWTQESLLYICAISGVEQRLSMYE